MMHAIGSGASGLLTLFLGMLVVVKSRGSPERKVFAWLCLTIFGWLFGYGLMESASNDPDALLWARVGHSSAILVPIAYLHFTRHFLGLSWLQPLYAGYYVLGTVFIGLTWSERSLVSHVTLQPWGYYPVGNAVMLIDAVICMATVLFCWVLFLYSCRRASLRTDFARFNRLKYCCLALAVFSLGALDYLPKFGFHHYPFGFITTTVFVTIVSYAILVHRLMDIDVVIRKSFVYSVLAAVITGIYFSLVMITEKMLQGMVGYRSLVGSVVAGFAIALGFTPLKEFVQQFVDRFFFRGSQVALAEENQRLRHEIIRSERLKAVSMLAAGLAHEIKNPLAAIKTFAEFLPERYDDPVFREKFSRIMAHEVE